MKTWQGEISSYLDRLRNASEQLDAPPPYHPNIPEGSMGNCSNGSAISHSS